MGQLSLKVFVIFLISTVLVGCGGKDDKSSTPKSGRTSTPALEEVDPGIYRAVLSPLNGELSGQTNGVFEIKIEGDEVVVEGSVAGAPAGVKHFQNIMTGTRCPDMKSDANGDGVIDMKEAVQVLKNILIPLDSNLYEQIAGIDYGPIANDAGAYVYRRSATLSALLADLNAPDPDVEDLLVKVAAGDRLNLRGRVIMVQGVSSETELPETVMSVGELSPHESLPIACGKIVRMTSAN